MGRTVVSTGVAIALLLGACGGGGGDSDDDAASSSTTEAPAASSTTTAPATDEPDGDDGSDDDETDELPAEVEPTDWLTVANGLVLVSADGDEDVVSASTGTRLVDGDPVEIGFANDGAGPSTYTFELPAETTFDAFSVPGVGNSPGNTTFFGAIEIAGSNTGPDDGFEVLVTEEFSELGDDEEAVTFEPGSDLPVRWVRVTLSGALVVEPDDPPGSTVTRFTELIGTGTQAEVPLSEGFDGVWELTFADNPDGAGEPTELSQDGATVAGCIGFADVTGSVTGNVLRLNGVDRRDQRPSVYLLTVADDGELRGFESTRGGVFRARIGRVAPEGTTTECSEVQAVPPACGSTVYVNFDVDSADIRPDSEQVLDDLYAGLSDLDGQQVTIVGHTSTEGAEDYNQDLSERRAAAVVDALVGRGLDAGAVTASGKGEAEPLVDDPDETSRAINRRVEVACA